jgi:hypothetical protein
MIERASAMEALIDRLCDEGVTVHLLVHGGVDLQGRVSWMGDLIEVSSTYTTAYVRTDRVLAVRVDRAPWNSNPESEKES